MSFPPEFIENIRYDLVTLPADHNPDTLIAIPLGAGQWARQEPYPFVSILAADPNEAVFARTRICIHVANEEGTDKWCDGACFAEPGHPIVLSPVPFPELARALRMKRGAYSKLIKPKKGESPRFAIKNWHEGDKLLDFNDKRLSICKAIKAIEKWNHMNAQRMPWLLRFYSVVGTKGLLRGSDSTNAEILIQRFCNEIGLELGKDVDNVDAKFKALRDCIELARLVA
ncbi:MAG: hypothetical protein ABIS50_09355 [Luteolibacter sp.]|uniref:hypothetical protein n=1 Tax=Luteolibacter sp. TaxID=1962973 RepID=UPI0032665986